MLSHVTVCSYMLRWSVTCNGVLSHVTEKTVTRYGVLSHVTQRAVTCYGVFRHVTEKAVTCYGVLSHATVCCHMLRCAVTCYGVRSPCTICIWACRRSCITCYILPAASSLLHSTAGTSWKLTRASHEPVQTSELANVSNDPSWRSRSSKHSPTLII